jgi:hypothetical protein
LALALSPQEQAQQHLYLANGHFLSGDPLAAKREVLAARRIDPGARLRCDGVRVPVLASGVRLEVCGLDRAFPPDAVIREVRNLLARGDRKGALRLDPFVDWREGFMRVVAGSLLAAAD